MSIMVAHQEHGTKNAYGEGFVMRFVKGGLLLPLLLLVPMLTAAQPSSPSAKAEKPDEKAYRADVARWLAGDKSVDVTDLRHRHALLLGGYASGLAGSNGMKAVNEAAGKKDWPAVLDAAKGIIEADPLDVWGHYIAEVAYRELKQDEAAANERALVVSLLRSVTNGGRRGANAQDSWTAMSVTEEYRALNILGFKVTGQSLNTADGHSYDVMSVTDSSGKASQVWLNIDWFFGRF